MSYTRFDFVNWNNLDADNLNQMQLGVKQVVADFLQNLLNIGFGRGGWKNITFAQSGSNAVDVVFGTYAFVVHNQMLITPTPGRITVTGFAATGVGFRSDIIAARAYEVTDGSKSPAVITQQLDIRRVENGTIDQYGYVQINGVSYLALCTVVCDVNGINQIIPYLNEPRIDTRYVDGTQLHNGNRENLYDALKRLENMINSINIGPVSSGPPVAIDLSPYLKKSGFYLLTGKLGPTIPDMTWDISHAFPRHTTGAVVCEVSQINRPVGVTNNSQDRRVYKPHKDWFPSSTLEIWEAVDKTNDNTPPPEKAVFKLNGATSIQGVYVRIWLLIEDAVYDYTASTATPSNYVFQSVA
jgi:hypothetical protein